MLLQTWVSRKCAQSFNKIIKLHTSTCQLVLVKVFNFSDKMPGFSKTIQLSLFFYGFCITKLPKQKKNRSIKLTFI